MNTIEQTSFLEGVQAVRVKRELWKPRPDGATFSQPRDGARLGKLHNLVFALMCDGIYRTLPEIRDAIGEGSETGISARLRDFRKAKFGRFVVNARRRNGEGGTFEYQLLIKSKMAGL